ncbi:ATP-dependent nuclease [Enterococcus sp. DIV0187]|uniref:ATP-dependent nuclease n=1 Tax=Enterococcus sp. DIV0187 TaxID=2774644 RepID=UPI003F22A7F0
MKLKKFTVQNYKVFGNPFSVELIKDEQQVSTLENDTFFTILTGKNNMGKSTFLEAINRFYQELKAPYKIEEVCFNDPSQPVIFKANMVVDSSDQEIWEGLLKVGKITEETQGNFEVTIIKTYKCGNNGVFSIFIAGEPESNKPLLKAFTTSITSQLPYYIRPNMTTEEIDKIVSNIYSDAIVKSSEDKKEQLKKINADIQTAMNELKQKTDSLLDSVSSDVSDVLNSLFTEQGLELKISGGEVTGFSIRDFIKNSDTKITVKSDSRKEAMLLSEQGTGVQRMSLIYTIQKIIEKGLGDLGERMLLVDEPEAFLHPEAVRGLSASLYQIGDSMPIIITTHSPILINLENNHTVIDVFKIDKDQPDAITLFNSKLHSFDCDDIANMKILNYVDSYINEFFFSNKNIIIEGNTEKIVLKYIQKTYNISFHIIEARGKSTICTLMKILNQFQTDYHVLHDIDNNKNTDVKLKTQRTNCRKILSLKENNIKIYACEANFEDAFYGHNESSSTKTKRIYEILHTSEGSEDYSLKQTILATFNSIFELGINNLEGINLCKKVHMIDDNDKIDCLFPTLVND